MSRKYSKAKEAAGPAVLSDDDKARWQEQTAKLATKINLTDLTLGGGDKSAWEALKSSAKPLKSKAKQKAFLPKPKPEDALFRLAQNNHHHQTNSVAIGTPTYLGHGQTQGLDARQMRRMQKGKLELEARLDLHGYTQIQAQDRLQKFLSSCQTKGKRSVIVVTGKGLSKESGGILRERLPEWLNQEPNRARILSFDYAQPKDGGTGAVYVLLRRLKTKD